MKFLLHGNAPTCKTGYGVQLALLGQCLRADGHDVAYSSTYGLQGGIHNWRPERPLFENDTAPYRVYGCGFDTNGNDLVHMHALHWFNGEPGWVIPFIDVWAMTNPLLGELNTAAWVPIDHYSPVGVQPGVHKFFELTDATPIACSEFGVDMLRRRGHDPLYAPCSVNTDIFKPTLVLSNGVGAREALDRAKPVPDDAFVVGMVGMNKGWAKDRKGFNEAFRAFAHFDSLHPEANAHLYVYAEQLGGAEGINLTELAVFSGIPEHKIHWGGGQEQYGLRIGFTDEMMAATYTAMDVLLAPSHGEGFCVPIIEAHACGTPTIVTDFSAQRELVPEGTGWRVQGQPEWDPAHHAEYVQPYIGDVIDKLEDAWKADRASMTDACVAHGGTYDTHDVYFRYWRPTIAALTAAPETLELDREPMPEQNAVAVLCPIYKRTEHIKPLAESFIAATRPGEATLLFIAGADTSDNFDAVQKLLREVWDEHEGENIASVGVQARGNGDSCASKWNLGYQLTYPTPWVLCIGDDVRFHDGWLDAARALSDRYDVIGTNDTAGAPKNRKVANGSHADHFFVRRSYVDEYGACLDGPGVLAPEVYRHWYVDMEIIKLARAKGVFAPCLDSIVEHLHPGYDGNEQAREADPTYMLAVEHSAQDHATYVERLPYIEQQRTTRAKI